MGVLADIFSGGAKGVMDGVKGLIGEFHASPEKKAEIEAKLEGVITERLNVIQQQVLARFKMVSEIIQAEMASGDNYTKRARPTLVYFGMLVIFYNYCIVPSVQAWHGAHVAAFDLPVAFWTAWGGVVGVWTLGRSAEKIGKSNKVTRTITGSKALGDLLD